MTKQSNNSVKQRNGRTRASVAIIASLLVFCVTAAALWALTTLSLVYAIAAAAPAAVIVACGIAMVDAVADCFAAIVDALATICAAIAEAVGAIVAAVLAALAAVFSIFGG